MAKTGKLIIVGIVSLAIAYAFITLWPQFDSKAEQITIIEVGIVGFLASFVAIYFMTKGGD